MRKLKMKNLFLLICFINIFVNANANATGGGGGHPSRPVVDNCYHLKYGVPKVTDLLLCREGYALGYDNKLKSAIWVSYLLDRETSPGVERTNNFKSDPDIETEFRSTLTDYDEPLYDMGHLANSESIDRSIRANDETFYLSNMTPQLPKHNRAIWKGIENRERKWANKRGQVLVLSGPVYDGDIEYIGNDIPVPSSYWKVIFDPKLNEAIAFLIPHKPLKTSQLDEFIVSIDLVESLYSLDFLSPLKDEIETQVERETLKKQWQ